MTKALVPLVFFISIVLARLLVHGKIVEKDVDLNVDKSNWKDPYDLFNDAPFAADNAPRTSTGQEESLREYEEALTKLRAAYTDLERRREDSVDVLLKHILRQFLRDLEVDEKSDTSFYKKTYASLSEEKFAVIKRYLASQKVVEEVALRERVREALHGLITLDYSDNESSSYLDAFHRFLPYLMILNCLLLLPALCIILKTVLTRNQIIYLLINMWFWTSFYFTYRKMYQEVIARRAYTLEKDSSNICKSSTFIGEAWNAFLGLVRIKEKDACLKKYEDILIEPLFEVNPLNVVAEVLTSFVLHPLSSIGRHTNEFFNEFFRDSPLWLNAIKLIFLLVVLTLIFFYCSNYRIRTLIATFEPAAVPILDYLPRRISLLNSLNEEEPKKKRKALHPSQSQPNALQKRRTPYEDSSEFESDADVSTNTLSSHEAFGHLDDSLVTRRRPDKRSLSAPRFFKR